MDDSHHTISSGLEGIPLWAVMGAWIIVGSWNIQLASFHAGISGLDGSQPPGYFQWFRKNTSGIRLGQYDFLTFPVSWVRSHVIARDQQGAKASDSWLASIPNYLQLAGMDHKLQAIYSGSDGIPVGWYWARTPTSHNIVGQHRSRAGGSCLASILNQLQLARMDDTLWAIYSGSEGTPVGFYWVGICSGKVQSAGPNSQLMTITWDTYQPYDRGPGTDAQPMVVDWHGCPVKAT
ncbi:hypothetical protein F5J12DRAFT_785940 [Pisolithus orientalis]|uniref:uncharacterized protein n=1 Tax=Pisolithus orientalis TaxID=936130 RepID=UPI002224EFF7|nr:uncharacterized protein F5J12DRAFT_785940 [Pisolithus orientalis]KAI5993819.1 hypothetical protein F5J12DRAFT_785940 [Pisolithus orientalis]